MSERVCQFFLRGRCQREKCEFRHPADRAQTVPTASAPTTTTAAAAPAKLPVPVSVPLPEKKPGFESDDDVSVDSENESIVSGFVHDVKAVPAEVNIIETRGQIVIIFLWSLLHHYLTPEV